MTDVVFIERKKKRKMYTVSYGTFVFFFLIKNMIAFKIEVVFVCKAVLDFGWCRKHAWIVTFQYIYKKKKNKKKTKFNERSSGVLFIHILRMQEAFLTLINACVAKECDSILLFSLPYEKRAFHFII